MTDDVEQGNRWRAAARAKNPDRYANAELFADDVADVLIEARRLGLTGDEHAAAIIRGMRPIIDAVSARAIRQHHDIPAELLTVPDHAGHPVVAAVADAIGPDELGPPGGPTSDVVHRAMRVTHSAIVQQLTGQPPAAATDDVADARIHGNPGQPGDRVRVWLAAGARPGYNTGTIVGVGDELIVEIAALDLPCPGCSSLLCPDCRPPTAATLAQPVRFCGSVTMPAGPDYPGGSVPAVISARDLPTGMPTVMHLPGGGSWRPDGQPLTRDQWVAAAEDTGSCPTCAAWLDVKVIEVGDLRGNRQPGLWSCPNGCSPDGMLRDEWARLAHETGRCPIANCRSGEFEHGSVELPNEHYVEHVPSGYLRCGGGHDNDRERVRP